MKSKKEFIEEYKTGRIPELAIRKTIPLRVYQIQEDFINIEAKTEKGEDIILTKGDYFIIDGGDIIIGWKKENFEKEFIVLREYSDLYVFRREIIGE